MLTVFLKRIFKGVSRMFQLSFILRFFCCMNLIAATRAEGGLVFFTIYRFLVTTRYSAVHDDERAEDVVGAPGLLPGHG